MSKAGQGLRHWGLGLACVALAACSQAPAPGDASVEAGAPDVAVDAAGDVTAFDGPAGDALAYPLAPMLAERPALPSLLDSHDGTRRANSVADWEGWRRAELRDLFSFYVYGYTPSQRVSVTATQLARIDDFVPSSVSYREVELRLGDLPTRLHVALFLPVGVARPAVFLALNKCGNQETSSDPRVRPSTAWIEAGVCGATPEAARGVRASHWPIATILARGYAFATFHESEVDPDDQTDREFTDGVHPHLVETGRDPRVRWGRIAAWAWGLSRATDWLRESGLVDPERVAVVGHSRRGKASLLAGAMDDRISMVIAHQSGTAGAALFRSPVGETISAINLFFPAWFDEVFHGFASRELRTPVDQHQLIALVAPRPTLVTDGTEDTHADPPGARAAVEAAAPAWALYGERGSVTVDAGAGDVVSPGDAAAGEGGVAGAPRLQWRSRPGVHSLGAEDWSMFLDFADQHFRR